jgi:hypothetical protein
MKALPIAGIFTVYSVSVPSVVILRHVPQAAGRRVAYHTFSHVLDLDINFHLERRTGALSRILERGTAGDVRYG